MAKLNRSVNHDSYEGESGLRSSALGTCSVRRYREIWGYGSKVLIVCLSRDPAERGVWASERRACQLVARGARRPQSEGAKREGPTNSSILTRYLYFSRIWHKVRSLLI
jgi:hypothetical protein